MALHRTPEEHDANPPSTWVVVKRADRSWDLRDAHGVTLENKPTKKAAEELKTSGFYVNLYAKEGRWFAGEPVANWTPYEPARCA